MIPLEDNAADIIGKAQRGLGISDSELGDKAGVSAQTIRKLRDGDFDESALLSVAPVLGLDGRALGEIANGRSRENRIFGRARAITTDGGMALTYLAWDPAKRVAAAFDTELRKWSLHHSWTCNDSADARTRKPARILGLREETAWMFLPNAGAEPIEEGKKFRLGNLQIDTRLTWGHSHGGMTYVVTGLARPIAIVGDSLFAGSMGGGNVSYRDALQNNLEKILTLPDETIICPGHGPMTTVGEEKRHNPFFAGKI
jgi:hypothetical protein